MKKYIWGISALALAIILISFNIQKSITALNFKLKPKFVGKAASYDLPNGIIQNPDNWAFDIGSSCKGNTYACSFTIDDTMGQKLYHDDGNGIPALNCPIDVDNFSKNPILDNDSDGVEDILMVISTVNGPISVPESDPIRFYQILNNSKYYENTAQKSTP
jgi:hypothetical protein